MSTGPPPVAGLVARSRLFALLDAPARVALVCAPAGSGKTMLVSSWLADGAGETRVFIGATRESARIGLSDGRGAQRAFIGVNQAGTPAVTTYDAKQRTLWTAPG